MHFRRIRSSLLALPFALLFAGAALAQPTPKATPSGKSQPNQPSGAKAAAEGGGASKSSASGKEGASGAAPQSKPDPRPANQAQQAPPSPEEKRKLTKIEILDLTANPKGSSFDQFSAKFNLVLPDGVTIKQIDVAIEARYSNGDTKTTNFLQPPGQRLVQADLQRPPVSPPVFNCNQCLNFDNLAKGEQQVLASQCQLNHCPIPTPTPTPGGVKSKAQPVAGNSAPPTPTPTPSASAGNSVALASLVSVRLTLLAHFTIKDVRGEFTARDSRDVTLSGKKR